MKAEPDEEAEEGSLDLADRVPVNIIQEQSALRCLKAFSCCQLLTLPSESYCVDPLLDTRDPRLGCEISFPLLTSTNLLDMGNSGRNTSSEPSWYTQIACIIPNRVVGGKNTSGSTSCDNITLVGRY